MLGINPKKCRIIAKAIFADCIQVLGVPLLKAMIINIEFTFHAFIHVNSA